MHHGRCVAVLILAFAGSASARANDTAATIRLTGDRPPAVATPEQDDATLHDVQLLGARYGWAVGDRGVIWKTGDGGDSWRFLASPSACSWRSVCFLTDQIGWIVGGAIAPYTRYDYGVVLFTQDGGTTWQVRCEKSVPFLHRVRFFDLDNGIAVGEASPQFPTAALVTSDGGATWRPLAGPPAESWRAAAFVDETTGYVGGLRGRHTAIGGGELLPGVQGSLGLRGVHAIRLERDGRGWLVGDGGHVLQTASAGATWTEPTQPLPRPLREFFDLAAVSSLGDDVWIAGTPGSTVWHSADDGRNWQAQFTGDPAPVRGISFSSPEHGCAVGELGRIVVTADGGRTWRAARAGNRRVALLSVHTDPARVPLQLVTRTSGEHGYRAAATLLARHDVGPDGYLETNVDLRLREAEVYAGGCASTVSWRLPLQTPGIDQNYDSLVREWSRLTDGKLPEIVLGDLVTLLRTWRPDIVVIDEPREHDAATKLLRQAILHAVAQAADPARHREHLELAGLNPWSVTRVVARMPPEQAGSISLLPHEILPRQGKSVVMAASGAIARLTAEAAATVEAETYEVIYRAPEDSAPATLHSMLEGLVIASGGDARRALPPITALDYEALEHLAQHQRNFASWSHRALDDERRAAQIIAQLPDVIGGAPPDQAALQLFHLAMEYRSRSQWQLAEETLTELVQRYPDQPVTLDAMRWLLQFWTSEEIGWQRLRAVKAEKTNVSVRGEVAQANVSRTQQLLQQDGGLDRIRQLANSPDSPLLIQPVQSQVNVGGQEGQRRFEAAKWQEQAALLMARIERTEPAFYREPAVQFTCAALMRHRGQYQQSDEIYRRFVNESDRWWQRTARGEMWILGASAESPKATLRCRRAAAPPVLDGLLSDICWQEAPDAALRPSTEEASLPEAFVGARGVGRNGEVTTSGSAEPRAFAMLVYDSRFLYFAATIPREERLPTDAPRTAGRTHDADLGGFDQISLQIDTDRDYATYYRFDIDSRGQTRDACWEDRKWNPTWYVAIDGDARRWTVEAAIPMEELVPAPPGGGQVWAVGIVRTLPTIGVESWNQPTGSVPRPETFGLVRFE